MHKNSSLILKTVAALTLALTAAAAHAIPTGNYQLGNHPDGNAQDPEYGLRLDGLLTGNQRNIYTFNFETNGAAMFMDYDGTSIHIFGSAWGGLDTGSTYGGSGSNAPRLWNIDFTYDVGLTDIGGGGVGVMALLQNTGTISSDLGTWDLVDYHNSGPDGFSFFLDFGHRGFDGISGWGWLNHCMQGGNESNLSGGSCDRHLYSSDWLFTAHLVPEPTTLLLLAIGLAAVGFGGRRKKLV